MGLACTVCALPTAGAINERLRSDRSARAVAAEFGLSYDALTRHARNHVGRQVIAGRAADGPTAASRHADPARRAHRRPPGPRPGRQPGRHPRVPARPRRAGGRPARRPRRPRDLATEPEWLAVRTALLRGPRGLPRRAPGRGRAPSMRRPSDAPRSGSSDRPTPALRRVAGCTGSRPTSATPSWRCRAACAPSAAAAGQRLEVDHDHRHCPGATGCRRASGACCARAATRHLGRIGDRNIPRLLRYLAR